MKKETISYVRHIMGSDFVQLDFFNACLAVAIIVTCFIAFISGRIVVFGVSFILGDVPVFFNTIKCVMKRSLVGIVTFGTIFLVLLGIVFFIFKYLV